MARYKKIFSSRYDYIKSMYLLKIVGLMGTFTFSTILATQLTNIVVGLIVAGVALALVMFILTKTKWVFTDELEAYFNRNIEINKQVEASRAQIIKDYDRAFERNDF